MTRKFLFLKGAFVRPLMPNNPPPLQPDNEQGMVVENVTVAKQLSAPSQVKPKKWTGPVKVSSSCALFSHCLVA